MNSIQDLLERARKVGYPGPDNLWYLASWAQTTSGRLGTGPEVDGEIRRDILAYIEHLEREQKVCFLSSIVEDILFANYKSSASRKQKSIPDIFARRRFAEFLAGETEEDPSCEDLAYRAIFVGYHGHANLYSLAQWAEIPPENRVKTTKYPFSWPVDLDPVFYHRMALETVDQDEFYVLVGPLCKEGRKNARREIAALIDYKRRQKDDIVGWIENVMYAKYCEIYRDGDTVCGRYEFEQVMKGRFLPKAARRKWNTEPAPRNRVTIPRMAG